MKNSLKYIGIPGIYMFLYGGILWGTYSDSRAFDGPLSLGFPFPFYFGGGHCFPSCGPFFLWQYFLIDIFLFLFPLIIYSIVIRKISTSSSF